MELREDQVAFDRPSKTAAGYLRAPARLTRVGIFEYRDPVSGKLSRELRPADEVFNADSLDSLRMVPLTLGHPAGGLDAKRARKESRGSVGENVVQDGDFVAASIVVHDETMVQALEDGTRQISCGYSCKVDPTPGEYNGQRYDGVQREIRYNHVALVERGRAGPEVAVRMDHKQEIRMAKMKIGEVEVDVPEEVKGAFDALQAESAGLKASLATMVKKDEMDGLKARADALEAQVKELPKMAKARAALEREAAKFISADKFDAMTDVEIKKEVVKALLPEMKLDDASDVYVDGAFATAVKAAPVARGAAGLSAFRTATAVTQKTDTKTAHERMVERQASAWKNSKETK